MLHLVFVFKLNLFNTSTSISGVLECHIRNKSKLPYFKFQGLLYLILKWVKDIIEIGQQDRPDIFDLKAARPPPLYAEVLEIDERVITCREDCQLNTSGCNIEKGSTGEDFIIKTLPDKNKILHDLKNLKKNGIESIAIVLLHAYAYHKHELLIEQIAKERFLNKTHSLIGRQK